MVDHQFRTIKSKRTRTIRRDQIREHFACVCDSVRVATGVSTRVNAPPTITSFKRQIGRTLSAVRYAASPTAVPPVQQHRKSVQTARRLERADTYHPICLHRQVLYDETPLRVSRRSEAENQTERNR